MKVIMLSAVAVLVLGLGAGFLLDRSQERAHEVFLGSGARIDDPGSNLVGPDWDGLGRPAKKG